MPFTEWNGDAILSQAIYYHLANPRHPFFPIFANNLLVSNGYHESASASASGRMGKRAHPGVVSHYQFANPHQDKESVFEAVRAREFPSLPTRLGAYFAFCSLADAERANREWKFGECLVLECTIWNGSNFATFDSVHLNAAKADWEDAARRYWSGEQTPSSLPECVIDGALAFDIEPHRSVLQAAVDKLRNRNRHE